MRRTILRVGSGAVVMAVAVRVAVLRRTWALHHLPERLRRARPLPQPLRDPELLAAAVDRLAPLLPPWRLGWCLKRSLLLLDLWSRCGLEARLHVGVRHGEAGGVEGHAWIAVASRLAGAGPPPVTAGFVDVWSA